MANHSKKFGVGHIDRTDLDDDDERKYTTPPYAVDGGSSSFGGLRPSRADASPHWTRRDDSGSGGGHSSPSITQSQHMGRTDPFGNARPREDVLRDREIDPSKVKKPSIKRSLPVEETLIMDEIEHFKVQLAEEIKHGEFPGGIRGTLEQMIAEKEQKLQTLRNARRYGS